MAPPTYHPPGLCLDYPHLPTSALCLDPRLGVQAALDFAYTVAAARRSEQRRILNFIRMSDYMICDTLHTVRAVEPIMHGEQGEPVVASRLGSLVKSADGLMGQMWEWGTWGGTRVSHRRQKSRWSRRLDCCHIVRRVTVKPDGGCLRCCWPTRFIPPRSITASV